MKSFLQLIRESQSGNKYANAEILKRMEPLVFKYAHKLHCMEYEDAIQELYLHLLILLPYLKPDMGEEQCLSYIKSSIYHHYRRLCHQILSTPKLESLETCHYELPDSYFFDHTLIDVQSYIHSFAVNSVPYKILSSCFYFGKSDQQIADELHLSRQYINRRKKELLYKYISQS